ncbi:MAG: protein kinase [Planctomycetaceae bacterium]|jgi:serine/threonine protein kinase/TM2 domain-containing membrane protein YozV|nr:protein kinase [Planctomycetaceae bacterium]
MDEQATQKCCPKCGKAVTSDAAEGLCAACLLMLAAGGTHSGEAAPPSIETVAAAFPQLEIIGLIGHGGMGTVFKAKQPKLNRYVALKILSEQLSHHEHFADRFLREAQLLAKLNHPNIVAVHDFGSTGGFYYLTMEFVDGVNLREAMREAKFTPQQTLPIVQKICEALQFAHEEGILHRDIKPENILLDTKGRVKIADFGIGLFKETEMSGNPDRLTQTGQVLGTPNYMAPEQIETPNAVDHRADIYSLGVVFYELLTGELPLGRFPLPSEKTPAASALDDVVIKALKKNREERQQSAEELKTEIETAAKDKAEPYQRKPYYVPAANAPAAIPKQTPPKRTWRRRSFEFAACVFFAVVAVILLNKIVFPSLQNLHHTLRGGNNMNGQHADTVSLGVISIMILMMLAIVVVGIVLIVYFATRSRRQPQSIGAPVFPQFCTHCGNRLPEQMGGRQVYACPQCGFSPRTKRNFCYHCGIATNPEQIMCVQCGSPLAQSPLGLTMSLNGGKNKIIAGLLAILLGWLGVHKFYLESWGWGIVYVMFSWTGIPCIVGIIEGIIYLLTDDYSFDIRYNQTSPGAFRW